MSAHVMLNALSIRDLPDARTVRVVRERDLEGFDVRRVKDAAAFHYAIYNRCVFAGTGGWKFARTLADVRATIARAP